MSPTPAKSRQSGSKMIKQASHEAALGAEAEQRALKVHKQKRAWDFAGLVLLLLGALLCLAVLGVTHGHFVDAGAALLKRWFGVGRFVIAATVFAAGWLLLLWRKRQDAQVSLFRVVLVEVGFILLLGALSAFFDDTVSKVNLGTSAGGIVGFGTAYPFKQLLTRIPAGVVLFMLGLIASLFGLNLVGRLDRWAKARLGEDAQPASEQQELPQAPSAAVTAAAPTASQTRKPASKPPRQESLPLEFGRDNGNFEDDEPHKPTDYHRSEELPPLSLLEIEKPVAANQATINMNAGLIEKTLSEFGVPAKVVGYRVGPTVTQYAVEPGYFEKASMDDKKKVRIAKISGLSKDLALALKADRLRIVAPVPGKSYVGVEVPNTEHMLVRLRPLLESDEFAKTNSPLAIPLGRGVSGEPIVSDLATMPHLLIAGTTNSGKSICISAITLSLVMNNHPDDLKLVMIDPKRVELRRFRGLPHLYGEVETEVDRVMGVLRWALTEMENRYRLLETVGARDLEIFNRRMIKAGKPKLPRVVIIIDELADLILNTENQAQDMIVRLAQKARAIGIHLIVATQRPSVDVVTGTIKANFPTRIAFTVASLVDSRVILDRPGAETLLGKGDMLFLHPQTGLLRSQGVLISDNEIRSVIKWWSDHCAPGEHQRVDLSLLAGEEPAKTPVLPAEAKESSESAPWEATIQEQQPTDTDEARINQAIDLVRRTRRASASYLQRHMRLGYPLAAWLMDQLEARGVIGPAQSGGKEREILIDPPDSDENEDEAS